MRPILFAALLLVGILPAMGQEIPRPSPDELVPGMAMFAEGRVNVDTVAQTEADAFCRGAGFEADPTFNFFSCSAVENDTCRVVISEAITDTLIRYLLELHEIAYCGGWRP